MARHFINGVSVCPVVVCPPSLFISPCSRVELWGVFLKLLDSCWFDDDLTPDDSLSSVCLAIQLRTRIITHVVTDSCEGNDNKQQLMIFWSFSVFSRRKQKNTAIKPRENRQMFSIRNVFLHFFSFFSCHLMRSYLSISYCFLLK